MELQNTSPSIRIKAHQTFRKKVIQNTIYIVKATKLEHLNIFGMKMMENKSTLELQNTTPLIRVRLNLKKKSIVQIGKRIISILFNTALK